MYNIHISLYPFSLTIIYKEKYKECLYDFEEVLKVVYNFLKAVYKLWTNVECFVKVNLVTVSSLFCMPNCPNCSNTFEACRRCFFVLPVSLCYCVILYCEYLYDWLYWCLQLYVYRCFYVCFGGADFYGPYKIHIVMALMTFLCIGRLWTYFVLFALWLFWDGLSWKGTPKINNL